MDTIHICMAIFVPPAGTLTVILALLAALISMPTFNERMKNPWLRSFVILVFCLIAAAEIAVISHADRVSESHFQYVVSRFDSTDRLIAASQTAQQRVAALLVPKPISKPQPASLKERAVHLSADILSFLTQRQFGEPPLPRMGTWEQDTQAEINYMQQTFSLYSQNFGREVLAIHDELASKGLTDSELDALYKSPVNPIAIRIVAERIGALAERLPN